MSTAKCPEYWDLFASKSIEENIKKARQTFFSYGSIGAFQGDLNPPVGATAMRSLSDGVESFMPSEGI